MECSETNLNRARYFIAFYFSLNPFIHNKRAGGMNHRTWQEICKYLHLEKEIMSQQDKIN